ncbi:uncharacterized protein LOC114324357 [Diabrotica virgifera virgifera]|uniref:Amino acid transporter AVT1B isoform X1 n=1 Tax=Diabrotica virgifera virgifera TaxID=50390 RepID=A0A6P7EZD8_DIAVI|nr:uncharacterized protein LOC114324357 [Diabrotica virgifera virgifera]
MDANERTNLLDRNRMDGLSTTFAIICILDVFGVFPVVTLPKAIMDCGYYGFLVVITVCTTQVYTAALLGRCWVIAEEIHPSIKTKNRYPYAALAEVTFGKKLASTVTFLLDLTVFGAGVPNLIVASQNLQLLGQRISNGSVDISYCFWIIMVGMILCPILWFGSPKDMKCLCSLSVCVVTSVFLLICGCILFNTNESTIQPAQSDITFPWKTMLKAYGILAFQFDIHPSILTIQVDMNDKSQLSKAIIGGFSITLGMFGITTLLAYLKLGMLDEPSILEILPSTVFLHITAALVAIQLCLTSAVGNSALYQQMEDCMSISRDFNHKRCILRTTLTVLAIVIAESVPRFDLVMSIIGGTLTGPLVFMLPPLIFLKMKSMKTSYAEQLALSSFTNIVYTKNIGSPGITKYIERKFDEHFFPDSDLVGNCRWYFEKYVESILCVLIVVLSIVLTTFTTYFNFTSAMYSYTNVSMPCIYNVSQALIYL